MTPKVQVGTILRAAPDRPGSWVGERALLRKLEPNHKVSMASLSIERSILLGGTSSSLLLK
jgi:hypothetical protein